jgi:hypothetical protein
VPNPNWIKTNDWNTLYLAGKAVPGVARVTCSMKSGIDTRKPRGGKKAAQKDLGAPPAQIDVELELQPAQFDQFAEDVVQLLRPSNVFAPRDPIDIEHPETRLWKIYVVIPGEIKSEHPQPGGTKIITFTLEEWAPAATAVKKSKDKPAQEDDDGWDVEKLRKKLGPSGNHASSRNLGNGLAAASDA